MKHEEVAQAHEGWAAREEKIGEGEKVTGTKMKMRRKVMVGMRDIAEVMEEWSEARKQRMSIRDNARRTTNPSFNHRQGDKKKRHAITRTMEGRKRWKCK